jgi:outer membrane protein, heavy metal efflux system
VRRCVRPKCLTVAIALVGASAAAQPMPAQLPSGELHAAPLTPDRRQLDLISPLRLEDVLGSVERAHPLLMAASRDVEIAAAETQSAQGGFDISWKTKGTARPIGYYDALTVDSLVEQPTGLWGITPVAGYRLGINDFPIYDEKYRTLRYGELRAGVNIPVWRNGPIDRRRATLQKAELGNELAALSYVQQGIELRRAASYRYWAWVAAGQKLKIGETLVQNVESRQAALAARVLSGDLPAIDEADNARAMEQRYAQLAMASRSLDQASIELSLFYRDGNGEPKVPEPEQLPSSWPTVARVAKSSSVALSTALTRRPEPKRLDLQQRQYDVELTYTENQRAPAIDVQVMGSRDFGPSQPDRPDLSKTVLELGVLVDIPLQNRVNDGRARALRALLERTSQQRRLASDRVVADVRDALSAIQRSEDRIASTRREVELALELERAERARFDAGDSQLLIVNLREQQTAEAELREVDAMLDYHRASADLKAACGQ